MPVASSALTLHSAEYYRDRAAYMRSVAEDKMVTPQLRTACMQAAADYEALAEKADEVQRNKTGDG